VVEVRVTTLRRLHTQVDYPDPTDLRKAVVRVGVPIPIRVLRFTANQLRRPEDIADALGMVQRNVDEATAAARSNPRASSVFHTGLVVGAAGTLLAIEHRLGRPAFWAVVGWRGASAGHSLVSAKDDGTTLTLKSYVAGTLDLEVW
jgi:hypothetical protein